MTDARARIRACLSLVAACALICASVACDEQKKEDNRLYFSDLKPPVQLKVKIVEDICIKAPAGGSIDITAVVAADFDRDELDRTLKTFMRQADARRQVRRGTRTIEFRPEKIDIRIYTSEAKAKAKGDDYLGRISRVSSAATPETVNRQKLPLLKWARKVLGPTPQYKDPKIQPQILADPDAMTLEYTHPFVNLDPETKGQYVEKLSYAAITATLVSSTYALFTKIPQLKQITFIGKHNDQVVVKLELSRQLHEELNLRMVQERLGAFQGNSEMMGKMITGELTNEKVTKLLDKERRKRFGEVFKKIPKGKLFLHKDFQ